MLTLSDPVHRIPLVGPKYAQLLESLGVQTVQDLLLFIPRRYNDTSELTSIGSLSVDEKRTIQGTIGSIKNIRTRTRKYLTEAKVSDDTGIVDVIWFNQPFLTKTLRVGSTILLNGKLNPNRNKPQLYSPEYEVLSGGKNTHLGRIVPLYPLTEGLTSKWIRSRINFLLSECPYLLDKIPDDIPQSVRECYDLMPIGKAIRYIHFPEDKKSLRSARRSVAFIELLNIQLKLVKRKQSFQKLLAPKVKNYDADIKKFLSNLDFKPTSAQKRVIDEIVSDFSRSFPSQRLLQGDVGSGKTLVAAAISIPIIRSGYQVALMAPTAILAKQHYETLSSLLNESNISIQLITGETAKSANLPLEHYDMIVGTHALLHRQKNVFQKLGLLIVDEQHRFGVKQREKLVAQNLNEYTPHNVTMTATPIPRSIALTFFGDLDISILDEMPEGRIPTKTHLVPGNKSEDAYRWIEQMISGENDSAPEGSQVFWICPLIEDSEKLQTKAVISEYERLETEIFPNLRIDLLHGRLSDQEKDDKIKRMKNSDTDILVSTSVIEVGMDIPGANIIVIEGAERFGLAQLHQLRGRVGRRAGQKSWCFLFASEGAKPEAVKRLSYFAHQNDGLKVAQFDLDRRGPGEVYGIKQAGIPELKVARLDDLRLIKETREAAQELISA